MYTALCQILVTNSPSVIGATTPREGRWRCINSGVARFDSLAGVVMAAEKADHDFVSCWKYGVRLTTLPLASISDTPLTFTRKLMTETCFVTKREYSYCLHQRFSTCWSEYESMKASDIPEVVTSRDTRGLER